MKKITLLVLTFSFLLSCSKDTVIDNPTVDLSINPYEPQATFDKQQRGVYIGSVVSTDLKHHAKIKINAGNNGFYTATTTIDNVEIKFEALADATSSLNALRFTSKSKANSSFTLDLTDEQKPIVSEFTLVNIDAHMVLVKSISSNRADVLIGSFVDINEPSFSGTFDVFTDGTPHPYNALSSKVIRTSFVAPGGALFVDEIMETFDFTICTQDITETNFMPLMYVNPEGSSAHFYADSQTSDVAGLELTWQIFHFLNDGYYVQFKDLAGFEDGCYPTPSGLWGWNGRYGVIQFNFAEVENNATSTFSAQTDRNDNTLTSSQIKQLLEN